MRRLVIAAGLVWLCGVGARADEKPARHPPPPPPSAQQDPDVCAQARASARYIGMGYTHFVTLRNGCAKAVECELWTDVDPEPRMTVHVAPGDSAEVVTRRGSPAREVTAFKSCRFK